CFISPQGSHALCNGKIVARFGGQAGGDMRMYRFALAALVCAAVLAPSALAAQTYPSKPIHFILPYVPGGIIDTAGRNLALRLSESVGVSVVPENRPGAGGMVGADVVDVRNIRLQRRIRDERPDGYTMLYAKANPGKLNFASAGVGTAPHLAGEMIKLAAG